MNDPARVRNFTVGDPQPVELLGTYHDHMSLVADDFVVPLAFDGPGFRLEPLGSQHN